MDDRSSQPGPEPCIPPIMEYAPPASSDSLRRALWVMLGILLGLVLMIVAGALTFFFATYDMHGNDPPAWAVPGFWGVAMASLLVLATALRAARKRWFAMGLMMGLGLAGLLVGICFLNP